MAWRVVPSGVSRIASLRRWIAIKRYRIALLIHACREPVRFGDRSLGRDRAHRNRNLRLMGERWDAKGPKPEDYGLTPEDCDRG